MFVGMGANSAGGYNLTDSVRLRSSASAYLSRTPTSAGNRKTWTLSVWFKLGQLPTADNYLYHSVSDGGANQIWMYFNSSSSNALTFGVRISSSNYQITLSQLQRDPSAWYHLVYAIDTTQATASNRVKIYFNGEQVTSFQSSSYPPLNADTSTNNTGVHSLGSNTSGALNFDGYMTEINFVDGQQLTPSDFGETDSITGVWKPKRYTGSYGTNGFYLPMKATTQASGFNTVTYTGNGTAQSITGVGFQPDLVWLKFRSSIGNNELFDSVRGAGKNIVSNLTVVESTATNKHSSFDSDGFSVGSALSTNTNGGSHVAWCWEAGGTAVANTNGTITSSVSANTAKGFSVVTYTGNGTNGATFGHGLGIAPKFIIIKDRTSGTQNWGVFNTISGSIQRLRLNDTLAALSNDQINSISNSVIDLKINNEVNASGDNYVAYCFAEVSGFSKFGSYTGTGSSGNAITGLGFRPAWIMYKRTDATSNWTIHDITRDPSNEGTKRLYPHLNNVEQTVTGDITFDSDGFTLDGTGGDSNAASGTYIYMAFADTRDSQFNFDASGNKNNWTPVNINSNASSETTYDIMSDVPTLTDEDTANFATLNAAIKINTGSYAEGNLKGSGTDFETWGTIAFPSSGKWYFEYTHNGSTGAGNGPAIGIRGMNPPDNNYGVYYNKNGTKWLNGTNSIAYGASYTTGDVIGVAYDADTNSITFYKNNVSQGATSTTSGYKYLPYQFDNSGSGGYLNFGQRPFAYTPPTGYKKLNTYNLPDSAIKDGSKYMNPVLYTGNGGTNAISGFGFQPDLIWWKNRTNAAGHNLMDNVRGLNKYLNSNLTNAEGTGTAISSIDSDGYTINSSGGGTNATGDSYVTWAWLADNTSGSSNNDGGVTSTVSANPTSGFSVVTADNLSGTSPIYIGHGLGIAPSVVIGKIRDNTSNWYVQHTSLPTPSSSYVMLNSTAAYAVNSNIWDAVPSTTTFRIGNPQNGWNGGSATAQDYVFYCFAEVEGFSKFGTYTGNASTDGPFVYTGFRPAWILEKNATNGSYGWLMWDSTRSTYNMVTKYLVANTSGAEVDSGGAGGPNIDILSNGFKIRDGNPGWNQSGATLLYMAFAESPFKNSLAR